MTDLSAERPDPAAGQVVTANSSGGGDRAVDRFQIFESLALQRLQTGTDTTAAAAFPPLPLRLTAIAAAAIGAMGVAWALLAQIPFQVSGTAAIVPSGGMASLLAPTTGQLHYQVSGLGPDSLPLESRRNNRLVGQFWRRDTRGYTASVETAASLETQVRAALAPVQGLALVLPEDLPDQELQEQAGNRELVNYSQGTLLAWISDPIAHQQLNGALLSAMPAIALQRQQEQQRRWRATQYRSLGDLRQGQHEAIAAELRQQRQLYRSLQTPRQQDPSADAQRLAAQNRISDLQDQLFNADASRLNALIDSQDQLDRSRQAQIANLDSRNRLEGQLLGYLARTALFAPEGGFFLLARFFAEGSSVRRGDELLTYTTKPPALPQVVPVFVDGAAAQQVSQGMAVLLTPRGISRAEYGGIRGSVVEVNKLPLLGEGVAGAVGSRSLAGSIRRLIPSPHLLWVKLEQTDPRFCRQLRSRRCYRWSSGRLPLHPVHLATLADVQITTDQRRPVEFLLPALRRALGLVVDNR